MSADPKFFFDTGSLALALVDTVGARGRSGAALRSAGSGQPGGVPRQSIEHLSSPRALAAWARQAGLGTGPRPSPIELRQVQAFREAVHRLLRAALEKNPPQPRDLARLNRALAQGEARAGVVWHRGAFAPLPPRPARLADLVRSRVAADARALLLDPSALRACADPECGWLFLDRSQARRRRWCSMAECGNRAKARRFRASVRK